jgi:hypothetical protein
MYACLYRPPVADAAAAPSSLDEIAEQFSPRYERHRDDLVTIDVSGLERLLGPARTIGEELRRETAARGVRVHVGVARTRMAAMVVALARPGLTVIPRGREAEALAPMPLALLQTVDGTTDPQSFAALAVVAFKKWGLKTLGEVAALPAADLVSRMGRHALAWQAIARGDDIRPLVPTLADERFESSLELEWPIEDLEPLSFVLTRLLEPLSTRLERRDRGAAVLHVLLRLVTRDAAAGGVREVYVRRLELPAPMRDVRTLRTLALLDLESHPPSAAIDAVTIVIDPTPGRVLQHTLFTRAHPTPEQLSTLVARLGALMGQDRFGAAATVDSYRPGAFMMTPFATEFPTFNRGARKDRGEDLLKTKTSGVPFAPDHNDQRRTRRTRGETVPDDSAVSVRSALNVVSAIDHESRIPNSESRVVSALRRCRQPVAARVAVADGRPVRVTTDRRGYAGGTVTRCAGPWRTSGEWWAGGAEQAGQAGRENSNGPIPPIQPRAWDRDEWDVALGDGGVYRIFRERDTDRWFVDAIVD